MGCDQKCFSCLFSPYTAHIIDTSTYQCVHLICFSTFVCVYLYICRRCLRSVRIYDERYTSLHMSALPANSNLLFCSRVHCFRRVWQNVLNNPYCVYANAGQITRMSYIKQKILLGIRYNKCGIINVSLSDASCNKNRATFQFSYFPPSRAQLILL